MGLQCMQDNKKISYIVLCFSIVIGGSIISLVSLAILKILLICGICYVVANFLKKRKDGKLGKSNHFIIECIIIISLTLNQVLGYLTNIYKFNEVNFIEIIIVLLCVVEEGILLFKE